MRRGVFFAQMLAAGLAACVPVGALADGPVLRPIISTGESLPGTQGGKVAYVGAWPTINNRGDVAVVMHCSRSMKTDRSLWVCDAGGKWRVAIAEGTPAGEVTLASAAGGAITDAGTVVAKFSTSSKAGMKDTSGWSLMAGVGDAIVQSTPAGKVTIVACAGAAAPGPGDAAILTLPDQPVVAESGIALFGGGLKVGGTPAGGAMWRSDKDGKVSMLARKGQDVGNSLALEMITTSNLSIADDGSTLLHAWLPKDGTKSRSGVWRIGADAALSPIAITGQQAPVPADSRGRVASFNTFKGVAINGAGHGVISATLTGGSASAAVFGVDPAGKLRLIVSNDDPAPGGPRMRYTSFDQVVINSAGRIAFSAFTYSASSGTRLCVEDDQGKMQSVAAAGDVAPGSGEGKFKYLNPPQLAATGQVAFTATHQDDRNGLWMTDRSGALHLLALQKQAIEVAGVRKAVSYVNFSIGQSGGADGRARSLNDRGDVAFTLQFDDKSATAFVATAGPPR